MRIILIIGIITLFFCININPLTAECLDQTVTMLDNKRDANEVMPFAYLVINRFDTLPDLTIEVNINNELTYWRIRTTIHNKGTATIPAGTPIVWKIEGNGKSLYWVKVIPFYPFEPNTSIKGLPENQVIKFNKLRWRGHEINIIVDPPYEEDYPWIELDPDPVYGLIIESNEDNNSDKHSFPKVFSFSLQKAMKRRETASFYCYNINYQKMEI